MAIETYGLTAATLEPYLTQLYGQYGSAGDGLSDTDVDTIIEDQAARVGAAIIKALGADGITNVAGDELASRNVRTILIKLVQVEIFKSVFQASVLPDYLEDRYREAHEELVSLTADPSKIGSADVNRNRINYYVAADDEDSISSLFDGTGLSREDRW